MTYIIFFSSFIEILKHIVMKTFTTLKLIERLKLEVELIRECEKRIALIQEDLNEEHRKSIKDPIKSFLFISEDHCLKQIKIKKDIINRLYYWYSQTLCKLVETNTFF